MLCNWCSSFQLCQEFGNMAKNNNTWNNIEITCENYNIDYYVIINYPQNNEYYVPEKTIIFQMEPWVYNKSSNWGVKTWDTWAIPNENNFLKVFGRKSNDYNNVLSQLELNYEQISNLTYDNKLNEIATICSSKYYDEGHIHRIDFLKFLESKNDGDIKLNIFNHDNKFEFKNYKGQLKPFIDKSKGFIPYKYYFMVENNYEYDFITEKLWEPIICETLCFYYGCPNVTKYIDSNAFVLLDMNDFEKSYQIIKKAIKEDWWSQRIDTIRKEKNRILNELQFFPRIEKIINIDRLTYYLSNLYQPSAWIGHLKFADYIVQKYKPKITVDLGVDYGHSTFSLACAGIGKVYGIDWFEGDEHAGVRDTYNIVNDTYNELFNMKYLLNKNITLIKGDFNEVAKTFNKTIDILHIDGLHTYEAVKNDFDTWSIKTHYNTIILMHDVVAFSNTVGFFFNEIKLPKLYFTHSAGLGVICQNKDIINDIFYYYYYKLNSRNIYMGNIIDNNINTSDIIDNNINTNTSDIIDNNINTSDIIDNNINTSDIIDNNINTSDILVTKPLKNICYIHSCTLTKNGTQRLQYLIDYLKNSKLFNILDNIYINNIGIKIDKSILNINNDEKFHLYNYSDNDQLFEIPTLNTILRKCKYDLDYDYNILYLHNKGISYNFNYLEINDWIDMMLYFLIDKYDICLEKLLSYDVVGSNYFNEPYRHFSGNFWWAKSNYLNKITEINEYNVDKMEAEKLLFSYNPKYYEMHNSNINHYQQIYPKDKYNK